MLTASVDLTFGKRQQEWFLSVPEYLGPELRSLKMNN
jgi:hypothetical protein